MFDLSNRRWPNCGCFVIIQRSKKYIPLTKVEAYSLILNNASRTTLTQTFQNPQKDNPLKELIYEFPLYDDVSVVSYTCTLDGNVICGRVKERQKARETYDEAISQGQTAGLLDQSLDTGDSFTMRIGNVPPQSSVKIEITYLSELRNDAEVDGIRFSLPTSIAPRYKSSEVFSIINSLPDGDSTSPSFSATVDVLMCRDSSIKSIQSPTHPIAVQLGALSTDGAELKRSLWKASVSLALGTANMNKDFVLQITARNLGDPSALLEIHPSIPNQRAIMITLVPKFSLPFDKPEIIFICDRSGSNDNKRRFSLLGASIGAKPRLPGLTHSLNTLLKALPLGVKFNICSLGSHHTFLWSRCQEASQSTVTESIAFSNSFTADSKISDISKALEDAFQRRDKDNNLEIFFLTGNTVSRTLDALFEQTNRHVAESKGSVRIFSIGIGPLVSHALVEGISRSGNGFAQFIADDEEKREKKLIRILRCSMMPHITDYTLEIEYRKTKGDMAAYYDGANLVDEKIVCVENGKVAEVETSSVPILKAPKVPPQKPRKKLLLFDKTIKDNQDLRPLGALGADKTVHPLPDIPTPASFQAPHQITPLFPFSRSNVYAMLLGPRVPESVTLKGTFVHGFAEDEIELEIPITILPNRDKMIHQLAARKTVKELEEGRGWIFHAQDFYTGKLLKDQYQDCFSDMVKREAVRLGTTYQVGGKWCSFVAVHGHDEENDESQPDWETTIELPGNDLPLSWIGDSKDISELPSYSSSTSGVLGFEGSRHPPFGISKTSSSIKGMLSRRLSKTQDDIQPPIVECSIPLPGGGYQSTSASPFGVQGEYDLFNVQPTYAVPVETPPLLKPLAQPTGHELAMTTLSVREEIHNPAENEHLAGELAFTGDVDKQTTHSQQIPSGANDSSQAISKTDLSPIDFFDTFALQNDLERDFMPSHLSAADFSKCHEPWALSSLETWLRDVAGGGLDMRLQDMKDVLRHLFTTKIRKMKVCQAKALSNHVVDTMLRAHSLVLEEEWVIFGPGKVSGVIWQLTGSGCYAPRLHSQLVLGRCYHSRCAYSSENTWLSNY